MASELFRRVPRRRGPEMPREDIELQEPPVLPEQQPLGVRGVIMFIPMVLMIGMMVVVFARGGAGSGTGTSLMYVGMMAGGTLTMLLSQLLLGGGDRKFRVTGSRRDYLRYLAQTRRKVRTMAVRQRDAQQWRHPEPKALWSLAMTSRLWERRTSHPDFAEVRIGTGPQRLAARIAPMQTKPLEDLEPVSAKALRRFIRAYTMVVDQPVAIYFRGFASVRMVGDAESSRPVVRALLAQLVTLHGPDELLVAACVDGPAAAQWEWLKWLPHSQNTATPDAAGSARLLAPTLDGVERLLGPEFIERPRFSPESTPTRENPYVVLVIDGGQVPSGSRLTEQGYENTVVIDIGGQAVSQGRGRPAGLTLEVQQEEGRWRVEMLEADRVGREVRTELALPDRMSLTSARALALVLAGYGTGGPDEAVEESGLTADLDLATLLQIPDLEAHDARAAWAGQPNREALRVPLGVSADGDPIVLDIRESAQGGMGPHGMLIGATGSGKSELLRTLVTALALRQSSETLNFVLVDFKGGATFAGLDRLPHVSALITNLADEAALVGRMQEALHGELIRRQELLRSAGNYASVRDYEAARAKGVPLDPLPTLCVIVDEFSELIATHGEFIDLFVMIGRLGRSLGVHLLLASQRVDDGRIHQLEGHLSYRIGLRTFSASESRSVIGVPDAYELPNEPGNGYLRSDVATVTRFKAAYVSGTHRVRRRRVRQDVVQSQVLPFGTAHVPVPANVSEENDERPVPDDVTLPTVMDVAVDRMVDQGPPAHRVWLPPLEESPTLDELLPPLVPDPELGLRPDGGAPGTLQVPVGLIDKPFEQLRDLLVLDLNGTGGHVGVAGGPQSGKSTLLCSIVSALALTHSPWELQFYGLDFGGGLLSTLKGLPHVGDVTGRHDPDRVNRTVAELQQLLGARERLFAERGITSMTEFRERRRTGDVEEDFGDVFVVVDGWLTLRQEFETAEAGLRDIAGRGLNYGVHLVLAATRWSDVHHSMRDKVGSKLELRLGDAVESTIDLRAAAQVPKVPGRGLTDGKLHFLAVAPRIDGREIPSARDAIEDMVATVAASWPGNPVRPVRTLPALLDVEELPRDERRLRVAIGIDETRLAPVWHDFTHQPHLTCLGDNGSGKSNFLRVLARELRTRYDEFGARILAVDYRRQLLEEIPEGMRLGMGISPDTTRAAATDAAAGLQTRVPGPDITPEQLRRRDWWEGPELFVLVDDYEVLAGHENPLSPLLPYLAQGADTGLHVVVTRAAAGVMRTSMDPVLRRLQELNTPDVALSCPPTEGPLLGGTKARHLPPGRAQLCTRRGARLIQTPLVAPSRIDLGENSDVPVG